MDVGVCINCDTYECSLLLAQPKNCAEALIRVGLTGVSKIKKK